MHRLTEGDSVRLGCQPKETESVSKKKSPSRPIEVLDEHEDLV